MVTTFSYYWPRPFLTQWPGNERVCILFPLPRAIQSWVLPLLLTENEYFPHIWHCINKNALSSEDTGDAALRWVAKVHDNRVRIPSTYKKQTVISVVFNAPHWADERESILVKCKEQHFIFKLWREFDEKVRGKLETILGLLNSHTGKLVFILHPCWRGTSIFSWINLKTHCEPQPKTLTFHFGLPQGVSCGFNIKPQSSPSLGIFYWTWAVFTGLWRKPKEVTSHLVCGFHWNHTSQF